MDIGNKNKQTNKNKKKQTGTQFGAYSLLASVYSSRRDYIGEVVIGKYQLIISPSCGS